MPSDEENLLTFHDGEHVLHLMKIEHEVGVKHHVCSKEFNEPENRKVREINAIARVCIVVQPTTIAT